MRLLARREHSEKELVGKLRGRGVSETLAREVIAELQAEGLQDERRFVESLVRARKERGMGPIRIRFELGAKGVEADLIEEVLAELAVDWRQTAFEVYRRKYGNRPIQTEKERARRWRFLAQRGFETEHIRTLLEDS